ncbi:hypothetical protein ACJJTC_009949, partial [Scirpophaga incertulas]
FSITLVTMLGPNIVLRRHSRKMLYDVYCFMEEEAQTEKETVKKSNIRLLRIEHLKTLSKYREEGRPIICKDESNSNICITGSKAWSDGSVKGLKKPISKEQRIVIVHADRKPDLFPMHFSCLKQQSSSSTKTGYNM